MAATDGIFSRQPEFNEAALRQGFAQAIRLNTLVIHCLDPRANGIPHAVAKEFGDIYPGEIIRDEKGNKVGSTVTLGATMTAGGRAVDAMRTVSTLYYLLKVKNVVVVHHTFCGTTAVTPDGIVEAYKQEQHADISQLYNREDVSIGDFNESLRHDVEMLRNSPGTPKSINLYGYLYDINTEQLTKLVEDPGVRQ